MRGQSTLEYILVIVAVTVGLLAAVGRVLEPQMIATTEEVGTTISTAVTRLTTELQL